MRYAGAFSEYNYVRSTERKEVSISPVCVFSIKPPIKIRLNSMSNSDCRPLKCGASIFLFCSRKHQKHTIIPTRLCIFSVNAPPPPNRFEPNQISSSRIQQKSLYGNQHWGLSHQALFPSSKKKKRIHFVKATPDIPGARPKQHKKKPQHTNFNVSARSLCLIIYGLG